MSPSPDTPPSPWCSCVGRRQGCPTLAALRNHRLASRFSAVARRKEVLHAAQAKAVQNRYDQRDAARMAKLDEQAGNYRRALTACLEGRGYTVK